jgi:hypothetical protein
MEVLGLTLIEDKFLRRELLTAAKKDLDNKNYHFSSTVYVSAKALAYEIAILSSERDRGRISSIVCVLSSRKPCLQKALKLYASMIESCRMNLSCKFRISNNEKIYLPPSYDQQNYSDDITLGHYLTLLQSRLEGSVPRSLEEICLATENFITDDPNLTLSTGQCQTSTSLLPENLCHRSHCPP